MWYVYRGINRTKKEVYYGVSKDPQERVDGSHCVGFTKAVNHWDCSADLIQWNIVSQHDTQEEASATGHAHEKVPLKGYVIIQTAGI